MDNSKNKNLAFLALAIRNLFTKIFIHLVQIQENSFLVNSQSSLAIQKYKGLRVYLVFLL